MAQLRIDSDGIDDVLHEMERANLSLETLCNIIDSALPLLERSVRAQYAARGISLARHTKICSALIARTGGVIGVVTFRGKYGGKAANTGHYYLKGKSKYPLSNAGLAVFLEYGVNAHGNFPALPPGGYIQKAVAAQKDAVIAKLQEGYDKVTGAKE